MHSSPLKWLPLSALDRAFVTQIKPFGYGAARGPDKFKPSLGRIWTMLPLTSHLLSYPLPVNQYFLLEGIQANLPSGMSKNVAFLTQMLLK